MNLSPPARRAAVVRAVLSAAVGACVLPAATAQSFPSKPIRIVNIYSAGGPSDLPARLVARLVSEDLGQPVIVENKPGGSGMIAGAYVAQQPADGYTLLLSNKQVTSNDLLYKKVPYNNSDFLPVSLIAKTVNALVVPASLPVGNVRDFVEYARKSKDLLNYAIVGPGGAPHLTGKLLESAAGIRMQEVSYKGASEAMQDVMAGRVQAFFITSSTAISAQQGGKVRILGITGSERLAAAPGVPTLKEQGYDVVSYSWFGLVAPKGTAVERLGALNAAVRRAVGSAEYQEKMQAGGIIAATGTRQQMADFLAEDYAASAAVLKPLKLQLD